MDSQANYRLVGGFIILISMIIVVTLLWLTNLDETRNKNFYTVYFRKHSLSGLQKDSYVTMKGITVGSVVKFTISPRNIEEVKVVLRLEPETPVTTRTSAIITRNLLTGLAAVELTGSRNGDALLTNTNEMEPHPVIPEGSSTFDQIAGSIPELLENVGKITSRVSAVFSDENVGLVSSILKQIDGFSSKADTSVQSLNNLLKDISKLSTELRTTSVEVSKLAKGTSRDSHDALAKLSETLEQTKKTFAELETQTHAVATSLVNTSQVISQQVVTVGQSISEAADSVSHTADSFENPRSLITGPSEKALGPGERLRQ